MCTGARVRDGLSPLVVDGPSEARLASHVKFRLPTLGQRLCRGLIRRTRADRCRESGDAGRAAF